MYWFDYDDYISAYKLKNVGVQETCTLFLHCAQKKKHKLKEMHINLKSGEELKNGIEFQKSEDYNDLWHKN